MAPNNASEGFWLPGEVDVCLSGLACHGGEVIRHEGHGNNLVWMICSIKDNHGLLRSLYANNGQPEAKQATSEPLLCIRKTSIDVEDRAELSLTDAKQNP